MATPQVQILGSGAKAAPLDYDLPLGSELVLIAVRADFDGSGAGGSFLPALEIISDAGHSVGLYPTDVAVAAGGSASVSFAPFLRNAALAGTGIRCFQGTAQTGAGLTHSGVASTVRVGVWKTSDAAAVALDLSASPTNKPILVSGSFVYTFTVQATWDAFVGDRTLTVGPTDTELAWGSPAFVTNGESVQTITGLILLTYTAPTTLAFTMEQSTGSDQTWASVECVIQAVEISP